MQNQRSSSQNWEECVSVCICFTKIRIWKIVQSLCKQKLPGIDFSKKGLDCTVVNFLNEATSYCVKSDFEYKQQRFTSV